MWVVNVIILAMLLFKSIPSCSSIPPDCVFSLNHIEELHLRGELEGAIALAKTLLSKNDLPCETATYLTHKTLWLLFELKHYDQVINQIEKTPLSDSFSVLLKVESLKKTNRLNEADELLHTIPGSNETSALLKKGLWSATNKNSRLLDETLNSLKKNTFAERILKSAFLYLSAKKEQLAGNTLKAIIILEEALINTIASPLLNTLLSEYANLSFSCLEHQNLSHNERESFFQKGCAAYKQVIENSGGGTPHLSLGIGYLYYFLNGGAVNNDKELSEIINAIKNLQSIESSDLAFILETEQSQDYASKEALYCSKNNTYFSEELWMLRTQNLVKWGLFLTHKGYSQEGKEYLSQAMDLLDSCLKADRFDQWKEGAICLRLEIAMITETECDKALCYINALESSKASLYRAFFEFKKNPSEKTVQKLIEMPHPQNSIALSQALFDAGYIQEAKHFLDGTSPEGLFLSARIADEEKRGDDKRIFLKQLIENYKDHPLNDEADFMFYSLQEYLSGGRLEMKHLEHITKTKKENPHLALAYYLIGLDCKKDRKTSTGQWIRKKSLTEAIDAFTKVGIVYHDLLSRNLIPRDRENTFKELKFLALFEQGCCNLDIAKNSKGTKKELYLDYSNEIFSNLVNQSECSPELCKEANLVLSEVLILLGNFEKAHEHLSQLIQDKEKPTYFSAKAHFLLAETFLKKKEYEQALKSLEYADAHVDGFSTDEVLKISMQKGFCLKALGKLDDAMIAFSSVVNANAVSNLRIQCMFERAAIYKDQNRFDLYRKQLEAIIKLGGQWQLQARQLLDEYYAKELH